LNQQISYLDRFLLFKNFQEIPFKAFTGKWFLLSRVREGVRVLEEEARKYGIYFQNQKGKNSFDINQYRAIQLWEDFNYRRKD